MYKESQAPSTSKFASVGPWEPKNNISVLRECNSLYISPLGSVRTHYVVFFQVPLVEATDEALEG